MLYAKPITILNVRTLKVEKIMQNTLCQMESWRQKIMNRKEIKIYNVGDWFETTYEFH